MTSRASVAWSPVIRTCPRRGKTSVACSTAFLRGLVLAQLVVTEPIDSSRERAALVEVLTHYFGSDPGLADPGLADPDRLVP